jgi:hypothetical protein
MAYCTLKNHVFGLCPLFNVSKKHNISETGSGPVIEASCF